MDRKIIMKKDNIYARKTREKYLVSHVKKSIEIGKKQSSELTKEVLGIDGMVCRKIKHFLNAICSMGGCRYLEVGSWQGASLTAALYNNFQTCGIAIEDFSRFNENRINESILRKNISRFLSKIDVELIKIDCWSIDLSIFELPFNIYFYDGRHLQKTQEMAFTYFNQILTDPFITIIDDWNVKEVRQGTRDAFDILNYKIIFEYILSPETIGCQNWVYVCVIKK